MYQKQKIFICSNYKWFICLQIRIVHIDKENSVIKFCMQKVTKNIRFY